MSQPPQHVVHPSAHHRRTKSRRLVRLTGLAALVGLAAGGAAYVLVHAIAMLTNLAFFHRTGWSLPSLRDVHIGPLTYLIAIGGALAVSCLAIWAPVIRGHGIPEAMDAILNKQSRIAPRTAIAKPTSAVLAIGTGGPFGAEGPIIVTGGALGSLLGQLMHVSPNERKILLASGAAAGMAATFGAPLAAVILAIELLLFEFSTRAFIPLVVATSIAAGVHSALFGSGPLFTVPAHDFAGLGELPLFAALGLACGVLAAIVSKGLFVVEDLYRRLPVNVFWHAPIGAVLFVTVALLEPRALGVGYDSIDDVLAGKLALGALALIGGVKLVVWWLALASGTSGGTLAPVLLIGASFGGVCGELAHRLFPSMHISVGAFALVAMSATFGAATRATFASIVFLFELTRDYNSILPLMLATVLATLVTGALMDDSLLTEKLSRRGVNVPADYHVDVLGTATVGSVMTTDVCVLDAGSSVGDALAEFESSGHGAYPVVDADRRCVGIVSREALLDDDDLVEDAPVLSLARAEVITIGPAETVASALERMLTEHAEHLPVLDSGGRVIGIITRTNVLSARARHFALDRRQLGWLSRVARPAASSADGAQT